MGLAAAITAEGYAVQCYKKGPDYIDPLWLARASKRRCFNLDPVLQSTVELENTFNRYRDDSAMVLVEGSQGLHDGLKEDWTDSNASLSRQLGLPVLLVIDARGMNRTVAALVNGLVEFDVDVEFAGLILNRVKSVRHERKLRQVIESHTRLSVLGAVPSCRSLEIEERELGLVPAPAHNAVDLKIERVADQLRQHCDLNCILDELVSTKDHTNAHNDAPAAVTVNVKTDVDVESGSDSWHRNTMRRRVAVARDAAFQFYYDDDLERLAARGIELINVSPLHDDFPDNIDGLLIGGGFPERYAEALAANTRFRRGLRRAVAQGLAVRAECAGFMYLCRSLILGSDEYPMCHVFEAAVHMQDKPIGRGYMHVQCLSSPLTELPATLSDDDDVSRFNAHEFHHSQIGNHDGVLLHNVVASYAHFRHTLDTPWVDWFLAQLDGEHPATHIKAEVSSQHV